MYVTATEIVQEVMVSKGQSTNHKYPQYLSWVLRGIQKLNLDAVRNIKTAILKPTDYGTVDLPLDLMAITKVGVRNGDVIMILGVNQKLLLDNKTDECGNPERNNPPKVDDANIPINYPLAQQGYWFYGMPYQYRFDNGSFLGRLFGIGNGKPIAGSYREDFANNRLYLGADYKSSEVYVEYITSGQAVSGDTIIDARAKETLIAFVEYQEAMNNKTISVGEKQMREQHFGVEFHRLQRYMKRFSVQDFIRTSRNNQIQSVKG
jgi:hypothetical protein